VPAQIAYVLRTASCRVCCPISLCSGHVCGRLVSSLLIPTWRQIASGGDPLPGPCTSQVRVVTPGLDPGAAVGVDGSPGGWLRRVRYLPPTSSGLTTWPTTFSATRPSACCSWPQSDRAVHTSVLDTGPQPSAAPAGRWLQTCRMPGCSSCCDCPCTVVGSTRMSRALAVESTWNEESCSNAGCRSSGACNWHTMPARGV
jgi:hypothetical protein